MTDNPTSQEPIPWLPMPPLAWLIVTVAVATVAAWTRFELIEPLARSAACAADPGTALCRVRAVVVMLFQGERVGWAALVIALAGSVSGWRWLTGTGMVIGAASLMLYSVEPGAAAVLLASIALLRRPGNP